MNSVGTVWLRKGRDKSVLHRHPWIFSGAVERVDGDPGPGGVVRVLGNAGDFKAWGYFNRLSRIQVRILDWHEGAVIDEGWWRRRLQQSIARRTDSSVLAGAGAVRIVYAEADGLPGLVVDRYGDFVVIQAHTAGVDRVKQVICEALKDIMAPEGIYERSDTEARTIEGLAPSSGPLLGEAPTGPLRVAEGDHRFFVDVISGQKTGFYIDQRDNRVIVSRYARGRDVLDAFGYTGAFGIHALRAGGRSVTLVESSAPAHELADRNASLNGIEGGALERIEGNVFQVLRSFRDSGRSFGMVVLDPPKLAWKRSQVNHAARAYKDVNLLAIKLLEPGGILATFSCSGSVGIDAFTRFVSWAALDAGRDVQILKRLSQGDDHPIVTAFPESEYLKGLICRVL